MNKKKLQVYLQDLEDRIDPDVEDQLKRDWLDFWQQKTEQPLFTPHRNRRRSPAIEWPDSPINKVFKSKNVFRISVNDTFENDELMVLQQLKSCSDMLATGNGQLMSVRSNYGTGILPSLFGAELFYMDDELNTLPTSKPIAGGREEIQRIVDRGVPPIDTALGKNVLDMTSMYVELFENYPKIAKYVSVYHPDCQGPMDCVELLYGSQLFLDIIEYPNLIKALLQLVTETYIEFMRKWMALVPAPDRYTVHWGTLIKGNVMLRDDSAMNFSPQMYTEFIRPYDQEILKALNGGCVHFCGRGDHYIAKMSKMSDFYGINLSQPECNDMGVIYKNTVDKGLKILGLEPAAATKALERGVDLKQNVQCFEES